jgi:hypothetical protein
VDAHQCHEQNTFHHQPKFPQGKITCWSGMDPLAAMAARCINVISGDGKHHLASWLMLCIFFEKTDDLLSRPAIVCVAQQSVVSEGRRNVQRGSLQPAAH